MRNRQTKNAAENCTVVDSTLLQDEGLRPLLTTLQCRPRPFEVLSFDFFDTLVVRLAAQPEDVFIEVGRRLAAAALLRRPLAPEAFCALRKAAERRARELQWVHHQHTECTLAGIYDQLKQVVTDGAQAAEVEHQLEQQWCYPNPAMIALARWANRRGYRTVISSDSYFSAQQLASILRANGGAPEAFAGIFTSSDQRACKADGGLFRRWIAQLSVAPRQVLHVGDNWAADCAGARRAGVSAHHYPGGDSYTDLVGRRERSIALERPRRAAAFDAVRLMARRRVAVDDPQRDHTRDGAFLLGPLFAGYAHWAVEQLAEAGVRQVWALMREGGLLAKLVHRAARETGVELRVVPLYTSRQATSLAALGEATPENLVERILRRSPPTVRQLLGSLGLRPEEMLLEPGYLDRPVDTPAMQRALLQHMSRGTLKRLIEQRSAAQRRVVRSYLEPLLAGERRVGLLDLGWGGTIQHNLARLFRLERMEVELVGCYLCTSDRACSPTLDGTDMRGYLGNLGSDEQLNRPLLWHPELVEQAVSATIGSTEGYREEARRVRPVLGPRRCGPTERQQKRALQRGVLHFQQVWQQLCATKGRLLPAAIRDELDANARVIAHRLIAYPTEAEARRFGDLHHDDNFGSDAWRPICHSDATRAFNDEGVVGLYTQQSTYWPQGVVARQRPDLVRRILGGWSDPAALGTAGAARESCASTGSFRVPVELEALHELLRQRGEGRVAVIGGRAEADVAQLEIWRQRWAKPGEPDVELVAWPTVLGPPVEGAKLAGGALPSRLAECLASEWPSMLVVAEPRSSAAERELLDAVAAALSARGEDAGFTVCVRRSTEAVESGVPAQAAIEWGAGVTAAPMPFVPLAAPWWHPGFAEVYSVVTTRQPLARSRASRHAATTDAIAV